MTPPASTRVNSRASSTQRAAASARVPGPRPRPAVARRPPQPRPNRLPWGQRWEAISARRLQLATVLVVLVACVLAGRLVQLQALQGPDYAQSALSGRLREQTLPATRGAILDADGQVLAASTQVRDVVVDQTLVTDPAASAAALAPVLDLPVDQVQASLTGTRRFAYVAKKIQPLTWREVAALHIPGVSSHVLSQRSYSGGELAANVLGFVGADGHGLEGLERTLEPQLAGIDGHAETEVAPGGRQIPLGISRETPAVPGRDVQLTINRDIQWKAQTALQEALHQWDAATATVVVMDAHTGDLLALATSPTFDANHPGEVPAAQRGDRSLGEVYEPGSTGKAITAAAGIDQGVATPDTVFEVPDALPLPGKVFRDHDAHPVLPLTLTGIMAQSSNVGTIKLQERMDTQKMVDYFRAFGIGSRTGVGLPGESAGIFPPLDRWSVTTAPTVAFGQGYSVTTLQMASVYATLANDGVKMTPRIIKAIGDEQGHLVPQPIQPGTPVVTPQTARQVSDMLEQVTGGEGTAPLAAISGYRVAGKTGTAQKVNEAGRYQAGLYTSSFIGFAPADAAPAPGRKLVVAVTIHEPKKGHYGGQVAGPVFAQVMRFALETLKIPPTGAAKPVMTLKAGG